MTHKIMATFFYRALAIAAGGDPWLLELELDHFPSDYRPPARA